MILNWQVWDRRILCDQLGFMPVTMLLRNNTAELLQAMLLKVGLVLVTFTALVEKCGMCDL